MSFPQSYRSSFIINNDNTTQISGHELTNLLSSFIFNNKNINIDKKEENALHFKLKNPLFFFRTHVEINIKKEYPHKIIYEFSLIEMFKALIILIIFSAFFSRFSLQSYLSFIASMSIIFMIFNILIINLMIKNILAGFNQILFLQEKDFTSEQKNWISDPDKCPACGYDISMYDINCPDCGIKLRNTAPEKPYTPTGNTDIKYHYKEKNTK